MPQHEINQLDLITQRAVALHVKSLEEQLYSSLMTLDACQKRNAELEAALESALGHALGEADEIKADAQ